jgi:hypothetical protein
MSAASAAIVLVALAAGPASAAPVLDSANWNLPNGSPLSFALNPVSMNSGDSVAVSFSSSDPQAILVFSTSTNCSGSPVSQANAGGTATLSPSSSTTYSAFAIDSSTLDQSPCTSFTVDVAGTPPPDVPEAPFTAGLLGAAVLVFGAGFFVLRRRAARTAA